MNQIFKLFDLIDEGRSEAKFNQGKGADFS